MPVTAPAPRSARYSPTDRPGERPKRRRAIVVALFVVAVALRVVLLGRWPAVQADEGLWTNSTKNFLMFGDWFMDGRKHVLLSPVYHLATLPVFKLLGASIASARVVSAVAGLLCMWLIHSLVVRLTADRMLATATAFVFAFDQWTVFMARTALIESTQLAPVLLAAWFLSRRSIGAAAAAGVAAALALLVKLNAAFMLPVLALWMIADARPARESLRTTIARLLVFGSLAVGVAAAVYALEFRLEPARFVSAFRFELDGVHFESLSHPLVRVGRFGLDPALMARTVIDLFRESPFLWVLGSLGLVLELMRRPFKRSLFAIWCLGGAAFFLLQMFQPTRYFYLLTPAIAFYAACALTRLAPSDAEATRPISRLAPILTFALFNAAYVAAGFGANGEKRLPVITRWIRDNTGPSDRIMTAGYFATDLDRRAYAYYYYADSESDLLRNLRALHIDYVVVDDNEWNEERREWVAAHFPVVETWPFGAVYRTDSTLTPSSADPRGSPARPQGAGRPPAPPAPRS